MPASVNVRETVAMATPSRDAKVRCCSLTDGIVLGLMNKRRIPIGIASVFFKSSLYSGHNVIIPSLNMKDLENEIEQEDFD